MLNKTKKGKYKYIILIPIIIIISILIELFVFNFRHFESLNYKETNLKINSINNIEKINNSLYRIKSKDNYIEFSNINKKINNIYLDIKFINYDNHKIYISVCDEGNELYYKLPGKEVVNNIENSKYIKLNLSGKAKKIKISFEGNINDKIQINSIKINKIKPNFLSKFRILILTFSIYILYLIRPKSDLYKYKINNSKYQKLILLLYIFLQSLFFFILTNTNPIFCERHEYMTNQFQYEELAESISKGKFYINKTVPNTIKKMKNPYDFYYRSKLLAENKETALHDHAYYKGKYYVYFGVVPCIIFYLPYYLITGHHIQNYIVILTLLIGITILILKLLKFIIEKYFKNVSFIHYMLMSALFINCSGLLYIAKRPDFYSVPIVSALFFTLLGLYMWMSSIKEDNKKINKFKLTIGSLSMALVAGCRPQFLLGSFFSLIIFKDYIKENKKNLKNIFINILLFIIPYIIIAGLLMYYNYSRFNSPFDFGANYNLTGNDMTKRGFHFDRTFLGIFYYLFVPTSITPIFPFIQLQNISTNYMGTTVYEAMPGGLISNNLVLIFGLLSFKFKNIIKNNTLYIISVLCTIFSLVIVIVDTQMAGILPRYFTDFAWLLFISTSIIIFAIINSIKNNKYKLVFNYIFIILFTLSLLYNIVQIPTDLSLTMKEFNSGLYYKLQNIFQFWL